MAIVSKEEFLREYSTALLEDRAAAFVGAGFSVGAGFVDWKTLLREVATDLGLLVDEEHDLIALAQYEVNRSGTRDRLEQKVIREFVSKGTITPAHGWLARLPLQTVWTTNYDALLEQAFKDANKVVDVKFTTNHLQQRAPYTDVVIYKMHGDVSDPASAVLTKDDYEQYDKEHPLFVQQLQAGLASCMFLFVGFSFTDPNIESIFVRLRHLLGRNAKSLKRHYCILRRPDRADKEFTDQAKFDRAVKRFDHRVADLQRFGVQVVAIDAFAEVEEILARVSRAVNTRSVMISGAAYDYAPLGKDRVEVLSRKLGQALVRDSYSIVSGFGLGISGAMIIGAHEEVARLRQGRVGQRLRLYPFPFDQANSAAKDAAYEAIRNEMAAQSGATVFICGNKQNPAGSGTIISPGVRKELEKALANNHILVPIGCTGHAAKGIWDLVTADPQKYFGDVDVHSELLILGDSNATDDAITGAVLAVLDKCRKGVSK
jgi:hypothetical protein